MNYYTCYVQYPKLVWTSWFSLPNLTCQSCYLRLVFSQLNPLRQLLSQLSSSGARLLLPQPLNWPNHTHVLPTMQSFICLLYPYRASAAPLLGS